MTTTTTTRSLPPLLAPYLSLPSSTSYESSLILLTSVLGAGTNWVLLRYLSSLFSSTEGNGTGNEDADRETKVVFMSFMRDMNFWREGARKINLDLDKATLQKRFLFIDGLTSLYLPQTQPPASGSGVMLKNPLLPTISQTLNTAITSLSSSSTSQPPKIILIIDNPDYLIASSASPTITQDLNSLLLTLREKVHSTILTVSIDTPLLSSSSSSQTPLETNSSSFATSLAHEASLILSTRLLDTGAARDVSGVLRITAGGNPVEEVENEGGIEERELLYFVSGDGSVRVFERGQ
ncbi:2eb11d56-2da5-427e-9962-999d1988cee7 [Sclerotinia trifoliorum]|uniref:2eb11d56-2da5-427e-9962-999d1988cee7 n=1 Tax=Sclerotinia trifoliorum TaxID=28548 RepID=A0A8H2ZSQ8_9HELO|nr:2eb11d56-2da5-427e-9962-999d1988cee7 [Sclerotinia trifoliorum]